MLSKELAAIKIGITVAQLAKYRRNGKIKAVNYKNTHKYEEHEIKRFIKENETK